ncbi:hypothetical protein U1769_25465 [Sphingomonas sp. ZT3P38]|uniref:hypothetical protein n=1 Tax=Parasphingomonas zepuensis TaxID=3096161 RepID=UPI002FCB1F79
MPNIIALANEYAPERAKATLVTVMSCGFPLGSMLGGFVTVSLIAGYGWQPFSSSAAYCRSLLLPVLAQILPESIPFLATRPGNEAEVAAIQRRACPYFGRGVHRRRTQPS